MSTPQTDYTGFVLREFNGYQLVEFTTPSLMSSLELDRIAAALYRLVDEQHRRRLLLDFAKVQYVSSQAIGMLMALRKKLTLQKGDALILCAVSPALMQLIKITGLDRVLTIKPQLADVV